MARVRSWLIPLLAALAVTPVDVHDASAQVYTGRIDATLIDQTGGVLPGVVVSLSGQQAESATTDAQGEVHFLNLPVGAYDITASLPGFGEYVKNGIYVGAGAAIPVRITMQVAAIGEQVQVTAQGTLVEPRRQLIALNVTAAELQSVPSARDPWVVLQTVPGVIVDRVNVGGSESGQQSLFTAKGADFGENTWNLDGIPITDMTGIGTSPSYYDFDTLQEMQVTTGGADAQVSSPGVHLNLVLKTGTNTPRGTARALFANHDLQSRNLPAGFDAVAGSSGKGNRTNQYSDYGVELGGPILKDRWWGWGALGRTDVRILTLDDVPDETVLENQAVKVTGQLAPSTRVGFTYFRANKQKNGRFAGPFNPVEATDVQGTPSSMTKGEISFVLGTSVFVTARGAYATNRITLDPKGGRSTQVFLDANGVFHNSFYYFQTDRPQRTAVADGNWFRGRHEIKFGASYRHVGETDAAGYGGQALNIELEPGSDLLLSVLYRPWTQLTTADYFGTYVGDTVSFGHLTGHLALRYDRTTNSARETRVEAHPLIPDVLPGFVAPALNRAIQWNTVSPRAGVAYTVGETRRTVVRASYAAFASQLGVQEAALASAATYAYVYYLALDRNHDKTVDATEILKDSGALGAVGVDLTNPARTTSVNRINPDLRSPRTHEIVLGADHELPGEILLTGSFTWRRFTNVLWSPLIGVRRADYLPDGVVSGSTPETGPYAVTYYALRSGGAPTGGGVERTNRGGYHRRFSGADVSIVKRLAGRWMGRLGFSYNDEREYFDDPDRAIADPTPTPVSPLRDGGIVVRDTTGISKTQFYVIAPRYQLVANGFWQGPFGLNLAATLLSRQGFGMPYFAAATTHDPLRPQKNVLVVQDLDAHRLPALTTIDVRLEKALRLKRVDALIDLDVFNVGNVSTPLRRQYNVGATGSRAFNTVLEIVNPRILRLGFHVKF
jgi:hypothetical protein